MKALKKIRERLEKDTKYRESIIYLKNKTQEKIRNKIVGKKVAVSWSGGKDSIVVQHMCQQIGIKRVFWIRTNLEYPEVIRWIDKYGPDNLEVVNTGQDLKWLAKNQHMLFPQHKKIALIWFRIVQNAGQKWYFENNEIDMLLAGGRIKDGNKPGEDGMNLDEHGVIRYAPIYDWNHEDVLAYVEYFNIKWPPLYQWANGFQVGTGPWAAREYTGSIQNGWKEIYNINPLIVKKSAKYITSASEFLKNLD